MLGRFFTPWRLRVYPRLGLIPLVLPFVVVVAIADGREVAGGVLGGDLPAFFNAGKMLNEGSVDQLYDLEALAEIHAAWAGDGVYGLPFLYPPFVAAVYAPLALLPYRAAYLIHTVVMVAAVGLSVVLLRRSLDRVDRWPLEAFLLAANFYPMFRSMMGGQNTALSLLCLVGGYRALDDDRPVLAGAILGVLFYKPQLALPVVGLLLLRHRRALVGVSMSAGLLWLAGAAMLGENWLRIWIDGARSQSEDLIPHVPFWNIDLIGMSEEIFGHGTNAAYAAAAAVVLPVVLGLIWIWRNPAIALDLRFAALVAGLPLVSIHVLWYEAGLLIFPFAVLVNRLGRAAIGRMLGLMALSFVGFLVPLYSGFPLFAAVALTLIWVVNQIRLDLSNTTVDVAPESISAALT